MAKFKALSDASQGCTTNVLYIDENVGASDLWEAAYSRIEAVASMASELANLNPHHNGQPLEQSPFAAVSNLLLADAKSILWAAYGRIKDGERAIELVTFVTREVEAREATKADADEAISEAGIKPETASTEPASEKEAADEQANEEQP